MIHLYIYIYILFCYGLSQDIGYNSRALWWEVVSLHFLIIFYQAHKIPGSLEQPPPTPSFPSCSNNHWRAFHLCSGHLIHVEQHTLCLASLISMMLPSMLQHVTVSTRFWRLNNIGLYVVQEKKPSPSVCLLYSHTTIIQHFWQPALCIIPPQTEQFCDTSWVYYSSTQFSHCQSGENIRSHRLRAQFYEIAPPFGGQLQVIGYPQLLFDSTRRGFHDLLPLGFNLCQSSSQNSGKHIRLPVYWRLW